MEGACRWPRTATRARADPAGLVLRRHYGRCLRADDRSRLFRPDGRTGALALPPRAQTRRPAKTRLELRFPPPLSEVREPLAFQALRIRASQNRPSAAAPWPPIGHSRRAWQRIPSHLQTNRLRSKAPARREQRLWTRGG